MKLQEMITALTNMAIAADAKARGFVTSEAQDEFCYHKGQASGYRQAAYFLANCVDDDRARAIVALES